MPTTTAFPFQRIRVKGDTQEIYLQVTTLTQDGGSVTENVTYGLWNKESISIHPLLVFGY